MNRQRGIVCLLLILIVAGCAHNRITQRDVRGAERLWGVSFTKKERSVMLDYLNDNRKGYDSMRKIKLDHRVAPAVSFDPRPPQFQFKEIKGATNWQLLEKVSLPTSNEAIAFLTVAELSTLIKSRAITSTQLTKIYLARLKKYKDTLQAVVTITEDLALKQAARADEEIASGRYRGLLHGIPYGIKDLFSVPGYKTTWGAEPYQNQVLGDTSVIVQKLEDAGAVLVAKLTSGALARGDVWFGGKTKNPWDLKQGASGSSAGSASATSAGLVAFAIGTETLGSIVSPSTRCGVTGLRPTFGRVSRAGAMTLSWSMDKAGPICRSAQDCAIVFQIIKGKGKSESDRAVVEHGFSFSPLSDLKGYKIGYFRTMFDQDTTRNGINNTQSLEVLKRLGAVMTEVALPDSIPYEVFDIILRAESGAFFDELVREHQDRTMSEQNKESRANSLRQSRFISAVEYLQANRHRQVLMEKFHVMIKNYDFIVTPSGGRYQLLTTNLTGHPAISIPNGFDKKNHPTSITLIGNLYDEGPLLEAAYLFQQATDFDEKHPPRFMKK